ncbi:Gfo/Idh/MocA family oxidoreductase [Pseudonocardia sp. C8]|uniref:Gfo/Idh/MocA family protein n=1 Tax=Pseudonocardia sp. C8 TaxID=2762759 RepID=UPI0016429FE1|nr:Gfo/Idh/MocA family oxidoreductase [Pseudonocardia sp. C8]MBC3193708.1 Gfo/Idh/MocA family oxidoreductase [Pseudonocardia sp. C8]
MPIRTALIGFGVAGRVFHAPFLTANEQYSLDVIVTADPERAERARAACPGAQVVESVPELWRRADRVDLAVVATPPGTHADLAAEALSRGLHVVVDKPFAPSVREAERIVAAAERAGRVLTVYQNRRWDGDFRTVRRLVRSGDLGEVYTFESRFEWWKPQGPGRWKATTSTADGGGILFDLGTHLIDQAIVLFGAVTDVWADPVRRADDGAHDADDDTFVALRHANGTRSRLVMSSRSALAGPRFHVLGSRAGHTTWGLDPQEAELATGVRPDDPGFGTGPVDRRSVVGVGGTVRGVELERGDYGAFYHALVGSIRDGAPPPVDPRDAIAVLELIERIHRR